MGRPRPSRRRISARAFAWSRWNCSSRFSSSTASMRASSRAMISRSSSFSIFSRSRCSRCCFTFSISLSRSSWRRFSALRPRSFASAPSMRLFSSFLCQTNRSVRFASPNGFSASVYPATSPFFRRAASFFA